MRGTLPFAIAGVLGLLVSVVAQGGRTQTHSSDKDSSQFLSVIEASQPGILPAMPSSMRIEQIREGDRIFHEKGGCAQCHGGDGEGMPDAGSPLTAGLHFVQPDWSAIQTLVRCGLAETTTRSSEAMPPRGVESNLTDEEIRRVASYVWAISQTRGEPWSGGHSSHPRPDAHDAEGQHNKQDKTKSGDTKAQAAEGAHAEMPSPLIAAVSPGCPVGSAPASQVGHGREH